jgi:beta-glucosidase
LKENGIEPYVTIHHFVCPEWFEREGGFSKLENVDTYTAHAVKMMTEVFPEVVNWMPFNEVNIDGFQKCVRGVYPPGEVGDIAGAGQMMRNMLLAHCKIYKEAKALRSELQIGSTHQWLKFEPLEGNPLEKAICYFLSKITHYACFNFHKTGEFSLQIPGKANVQFKMPEEEWRRYNGFSDFIGVQFYGFPRLKAGFNSGEDYPGYGIVNKLGLTFGSTCPKGGEAMSFGPGFYPESFEECLTEAASLGKKIVISETGCDAKIQKWGDTEFRQNEEVQRRFFEKTLPILARFQDQIKAYFTWTVKRGHLEWDRGDTPCLGVVDVLTDQNRNIVGHTLSPAAQLLQQVYGEKREELARNALRTAA